MSARLERALSSIGAHGSWPLHITSAADSAGMSSIYA